MSEVKRGRINLKGTGSKPVKGNISDNQIHLILGIPKQTLRDWCESETYRRDLYWFLKSLNKEELKEFSEKSKVLKKNHKL